MRTPIAVPVKRLLAASLVVTSGCAQVLGADDYTVSQVSGSGGGPNGAPLPAYLEGTECTACLAESCPDPVAACDADPDCAAWLDDARADPSPNGAFLRDATRSHWHAAGAIRSGAGTLYAPDDTDLLAALQDCSERHCLQQCQLGADFSCIGDFRWDIAFPRTLSLRVEGMPVFDDQADPWTVRACAANRTSCDPALRTGSTGVEGYLTLSLDEYDDGAPFRGYLTFDSELPPGPSGPIYRPWAGFSSRPLGPEHTSTWIPIQRATVESQYQALGASFEPDLGYLTVQPYDCRGLEAKHVRIEVMLERGSELLPCDTCVVTYEDNLGRPAPELAPFASAAGIAHVTYVPAGNARVLIVRISDDTVVASVPITVEAGRYHAVKAYPLPSNEG